MHWFVFVINENATLKDGIGGIILFQNLPVKNTGKDKGTKPELTVRLGMKFNGATILANRSVSMSNTLLFNGTYSGMTHHFAYGRSVATLTDIGKWSTNFGIVEKVITNKVKVHMSGKIEVKNRNWLTKARKNRIKKLIDKFNP